MTTEQVKPVAQTMEYQPFPWCIFLDVHVSPLSTVAQTLAQCLWSYFRLRQTLIFHCFSRNGKHSIAYEQPISTLWLIICETALLLNHLLCILTSHWGCSQSELQARSIRTLWTHSFESFAFWFSSYGQDKQVNIHALPHKGCYACSTHAHTQLFACFGADNELICRIYFNSCKTCTCTMRLMGQCCPLINNHFLFTFTFANSEMVRLRKRAHSLSGARAICVPRRREWMCLTAPCALQWLCQQGQEVRGGGKHISKCVLLCTASSHLIPLTHY